MIDGETIVGKSAAAQTGTGEASGVVALSGTYSSGVAINLGIKPPWGASTPIVASYTTNSARDSSSLTGAATNLAAAINQSATASFLLATASGQNVTLTTTFIGPSGNNITVSASPVPFAIATPGPSGNLSGGNGPPSYGLQVYDFANFPATATIALGGTGQSGQVLNASLTSSSPTLNASFTTADASLTDATTGLAGQINTACVSLGSGCPIQQPVTVSGTSIILTSVDTSVLADSIVNSVSNSSGTPTITIAGSVFAGGGTFDGVNPNVIQNSRDVTMQNSIFDTVYQGVLIPGRYGSQYNVSQSGITIAGNTAVRNGDALLHLVLSNSGGTFASTLAHIRMLHNVVKDGSFANGLMFIEYASGGSASDVLVQGGVCGSSTNSMPKCLRLQAATVKLMGVDLSAVTSPVLTSGSATVTSVGNLGY